VLFPGGWTGVFGQPCDRLSLREPGWWWQRGWLRVLPGAPAAPRPSRCPWGRVGSCRGGPAAFPCPPRAAAGRGGPCRLPGCGCWRWVREPAPLGWEREASARGTAAPAARGAAGRFTEGVQSLFIKAWSNSGAPSYRSNGAAWGESCGSSLRPEIKNLASIPGSARDAPRSRRRELPPRSSRPPLAIGEPRAAGDEGDLGEPVLGPSGDSQTLGGPGILLGWDFSISLTKCSCIPSFATWVATSFGLWARVWRGGKATVSCYFVLYCELKMQNQALGQGRVAAGSNAK